MFALTITISISQLRIVCVHSKTLSEMSGYLTFPLIYEMYYKCNVQLVMFTFNQSLNPIYNIYIYVSTYTIVLYNPNFTLIRMHRFINEKFIELLASLER